MRIKKYSKKLRQNQTEVEKIIWRYLRNRRILNCKFKRQFIIGHYIVDFVCLRINLIIEIDGGQHEWREKQEKRRTEFLESQGFEIIRYWNNQVSAQLDAVLTDIYEQVRRRL